MKNKELEKKYFEILKDYFSYNFNSFLQKDKPDFQNDEDSIGVELTHALNTSLGQRRAFLLEAMNECNTIKEAYEISDKKYSKLYKENLFEIDDQLSFLTAENGNPDYPYCENLIYHSISQKLKKFNSYKKFNKNILLIIDTETWIDRKYIKENMLTHIRKLEEEYSDKFDEYFMLHLSVPRKLFVIKSNDEIIEWILNG